MRVISWDVGIKNLAFCCIEYNYDNQESEIVSKTILEWNIINLIPDQEQCLISTCKKPVVHGCQYHGKDIFWCAKHNSFYSKLKILAQEDTINLTKPYTVKSINCNNIDIEMLRSSLVYKLDIIILPIIYKLNIDYVLIENQPALRNPRMKAIADMLYAWFLIRCVNDSRIVKSIHFISPSNKLKSYAEELNLSENKYRSTKLKSIDVVSEYLNNNKLNNWINHINTFNKKDDLCDSLLQGFYWIDKNKPKVPKIKVIKEKVKKTKKLKKTNEQVIDI